MSIFDTLLSDIVRRVDACIAVTILNERLCEIKDFEPNFERKRLNSFTAKFKYVVWDYFHVQYHTSFQDAKNKSYQKHVLAYENGLNITEKSEVPAQTPPFKGGV